MGDPFIKLYMDDILRTMRTQVLLKAIAPYTRVTLPYVASELNGIPVTDVEDLLVSLILDGKVEGKIDQVLSLGPLGMLRDKGLGIVEDSALQRSLERSYHTVSVLATSAGEVKLSFTSGQCCGVSGVSSIQGGGDLSPVPVSPDSFPVRDLLWRVRVDVTSVAERVLARFAEEVTCIRYNASV